MAADGSLRSLDDELRLRDSVLSALNAGVILFGPTADVLYANGLACELLGHSDSQPHGLDATQLRNALFDGASALTAMPAIRLIDRSQRTIEASADSAAPPGAIAVIVRDVTDARDRDRLRRDFVANASHELRTPVASILALAETLRAAERDSAAVRRLHVRLEQEAVRLTWLVRDLLALSRLEGRPPRRHSVDLRRVVELETSRARPHALAAGMHIAVDLEDGITLTGSESDLALMVRNLLDNAIRYTTSGGSISVTLHRRDDHALLEVADTGVGIPEQDLARVFERFYRVDTARARQTGGTGLGLAMVRNVAQIHGGDVDVVSSVGSGSTFSVRLPVAAARVRRRATAGRESGTRARAQS